MTAPAPSSSVRTGIVQSGQAALEFALIAPLMLVLMLTVIDFSRAIHYMQVMVSLSRQGSNLASRGTTLPASAAAVVAGDAPLDLSHNGEVIITSVTNVALVNTITGQSSQGGTSNKSKVGTVIGNRANLPPSTAAMLAPGQTIYVTEIFYSYKPLTPIANLLHIVLPSTLYEVAYF